MENMKQPVDLELAKRLKEDIPDVIRFYSNSYFSISSGLN